MNQIVFLFIASIAVTQAAGGIGSIFTIPNISNWYSTLNKPWFTPPNWVFGPVWITLYLLMGVSLFLVWQNSKQDNFGERTRGLVFFFAQLAVNALWSFVFFGQQSIIGGLLVIIILWFLIWETIVSFSKVNRPAGLLLYPYLIWVTFATILNFAIMMLNP